MYWAQGDIALFDMLGSEMMNVPFYPCKPEHSDVDPSTRSS